ncbi:MAG: hypothetical protein HC824_16815 [Synechococcales cyanobacterium RM1_1_8]|nr:hypothetical protein [Synechococcales cyanobacterium RM1_1_8]
MEIKLCGVAEQLEVPDQAMQTVAALLKVLKPSYDQGRSPARNKTLAIATPSQTTPSQTTPSQTAPRSPSSQERATAIQFGPDRATQLAAHPSLAIAPETQTHVERPADSKPRQPGMELFPIDDLEADLALLAASLEADGPAIPLDPSP